jgi:hypothetical protein
MNIKVGESVVNSEEYKTYCVSIYVPLTELGTEGVQQYFKVTARSKNEALAKALALDYQENKFWADSDYMGIPQIKIVSLNFCDKSISAESLS